MQSSIKQSGEKRFPEPKLHLLEIDFACCCTRYNINIIIEQICMIIEKGGKKLVWGNIDIIYHQDNATLSSKGKRKITLN